MLPVLLVLALSAGSFFINRAAHLSANGAEYETFFKWREQFSDFSRDSYSENPELYATVGWDQDLYLLADSWCYLDDRVNADTLRTISESSRHPGPAEAVSLFTGFFRTCPEAVRMGLLLLLLLILLLLGHPDPAALWTGIGTVLGCLLLTGYLCLTGRILLRSFQVICIPAAFVLTDLILSFPFPRNIPSACAGAAVCAGCLVFGLVQAHGLRVNSPKDMLAASDTVLSYASQHRDTALITDPFSAPDIHAFRVYPDGSYPDNLISWGGCDFYSRSSRTQLRNNGVLALDETLFFEPSVRFLTREGSAQETRLIRYLSGKYPGLSIEVTDRIGEEYAVYRFEPSAG